MKILWAVDIFENHPKAISASLRFLEALNKTAKTQVDAVTVVFPSECAAGSRKAKELIAKSMELLSERLGGSSKRPWFGRQIVLLEPEVSQRVAVLTLTEYAKTNGYDAILLVKHSGRSSKSQYLGSFAEMAAFVSSVSIFLVNPDGICPRSIGNILMAVDEVSGSGRELRKLAEFLPLKGLAIKLFHRIPISFPVFLGKASRQYASEQRKAILKDLGSLVSVGEKIGAHVSRDAVPAFQGISDAILAEARKGAFDLITIIHREKGAAGFFLGRVTRKLLRSADRPVLLFRL